MLHRGVIGLYTALCLTANTALAGPAAEALREGDMKKLVFSAEAADVPAIAVEDGDGAERLLSDWRGQWVVLNFWATWCAPCRHEMPSLDRLQAAMPEIAVLPVATGRNSVAAIANSTARPG